MKFNWKIFQKIVHVDYSMENYLLLNGGNYLMFKHKGDIIASFWDVLQCTPKW